MSGSLFSPHWYRVAALRPRLPAHARVHRHEYRGEAWYVVENTSSGRRYRFNDIARALVEQMDGKRTVDEIWHGLGTALGDAAPTQEETIRVLGQLHAADLLLCDMPPDTAELFRRGQREARQRWRSRFVNPLALRLPLINPDQLLDKALPWVAPLFSRAAFISWMALVAVAALLAAKHWNGIAAHAAERALTPGNLLLLWLLYPLVKILHELGHAFATKVWGGAVHEMGLMFLVLTPVPYVDASAASAFAERRRRMVVSAAGIIVELFLAALALIAWIHLQPGLLRDIALNIMLIGGISTVLFNGNPLLRFDGYYVLADAAGIPGLAPRAARFYGYLAQRHLLGMKDAQSPASAAGERAWFAGYGLASFVYRIAITIIIILYLGTKYFVIGIALALWALATQIVFPLAKAVRFILQNPALQSHRARAVLASFGLVAALLLALVAIPVPLSTRADGVLWLPEQAQVRAGADGFVVELLAAEGSPVRRGDALMRLIDPDIELQLQALEAENRELQTRYYALREKDRVKAEVARQELRAAEAELARMRERAGEQVLRAGADGTLVVPEAPNLPGRYVKQGEAIGFVVDWSAVTARIVVPQSDIGLIRRDTREVSLKSADRPAHALGARILREVPGAVDRLPSRALGTLGGGRIEVDPLDDSGVRARDKIFQLDLALPADEQFKRIGARVYARFDHGWEPLAFRWVRELRRQLLRQVAE